MSHAVAKPKVRATVRGEAITREGVYVLIEAHGPGTTFLERLRARRNHRKWCRGLRPDANGNWR